jgi:hypothetical protein
MEQGRPSPRGVADEFSGGPESGGTAGATARKDTMRQEVDEEALAAPSRGGAALGEDGACTRATDAARAGVPGRTRSRPGARRAAGATDGVGPREQVARQRARLDLLHEAVNRQHEALRALRRGPGRWDELERLHAQGERLHREDARLRAERDRGVIDRAAHARFLAELAAHREALRRFRTSRYWASGYSGNTLPTRSRHRALEHRAGVLRSQPEVR